MRGDAFGVGEMLSVAVANDSCLNAQASANGRLGSSAVGRTGCFRLAEVVAPLHPNRTGFHAAGVWLARIPKPRTTSSTRFPGSSFTPGRCIARLRTSNAHTSANVYVVLGGTKNEHERLPLIPEAKSWAARGHVCLPMARPSDRFQGGKRDCLPGSITHSSRLCG